MLFPIPDEKKTNTTPLSSAPGPNGMAAAKITLARAGFSVLMIGEGRDTIGGGARSAEVTLPGFVHDMCAAIHPLGLASPFLRGLPLAAMGVNWIHPGFPLAHPLEDSRAAVLETSIRATCGRFEADANAYQGLFSPLVERIEALLEDILAPLHFPKHPLVLARFGRNAIRSAEALTRSSFNTAPARALFAGLAAHSVLPLDKLGTASFGLLLGALSGACRWLADRKGGTQHLSNALAAYFVSLGGEVATGIPIRSLDELPRSLAVLLDVTPRQFLALAGTKLAPRARAVPMKISARGRASSRSDWALDAPIPWRSEECSRAATVHIGGTFEEILAAERGLERQALPLSAPSYFWPNPVCSIATSGTSRQTHGVGPLLSCP